MKREEELVKKGGKKERRGQGREEREKEDMRKNRAHQHQTVPCVVPFMSPVHLK